MAGGSSKWGLAAVIVLGGCGDATGPAGTGSAASQSPPASASAPSAAASTSSDVTRGSDEITPVYPKDNLPPEPDATRYCQAVHGIASERKAACCEEKPRSVAQGECVRTLSAALRSKALGLDEALLARCEDASKRRFEGCGWVGVGALAAADECIGILRGLLTEGAVCRSSLECEAGLRCYGLGATQPGRCVKPRPKQALCGTGTDTLAAVTAQDDFELSHPECEGGCYERRCRDRIATGSACKVSVDCGPGHSCRSGVCSDEPLPASGAACAEGECARGLRCIAGKCSKARLEGEACQADADCAGACDGGKCTKLCQRALPKDLGRPQPSAVGKPAPNKQAPPSK